MRATLRRWKQQAKRQLRTLRCIATHPRTRRSVKWLATALVAYTVSPIDLIPDFIPILGYLDEAILLPAGIYVLYKLTPMDVIAECRAAAKSPPA